MVIDDILKTKNLFTIYDKDDIEIFISIKYYMDLCYYYFDNININIKNIFYNMGGNLLLKILKFIFMSFIIIISQIVKVIFHLIFESQFMKKYIHVYMTLFMYNHKKYD
jgi:hypothetical protein